ncbi:hypothetical protein D021_4154B, partial [Vibrio parahaemolyticus 10296]
KRWPERIGHSLQQPSVQIIFCT